MTTEVVMPKLGLTMEEGTIERWLKREGDAVEKGEPLLEILTDKVTAEVEAPVSGKVGRLLFPDGATVSVGEIITHILLPGDAEGEPVSETTAEDVAWTKIQTPLRAPRLEEKRVIASPVARRLAKELGVDLETVPGSGPHGRISGEDVRRVAARRGRREVSELRGLRKATAERVTRTFATVPHFYLSVEADASLLLRLRDRLAGRIEAEAGVRLTMSDLLVKIAARALEEHPHVNVAWSDEGILTLDTIDVGLAVATERGLIVPVIRNANHQSLAQIAQSRADVVTRARQERLELQDVQGGSFTISNLGMFRVDQFDAIINSPQSALLAVGRIKERPVAVEGRLAVRPTIFLTLSVDHRILDGADAARFLDTITELIEEPYLLAQL